MFRPVAKTKIKLLHIVVFVFISGYVDDKLGKLAPIMNNIGIMK